MASIVFGSQFSWFDLALVRLTHPKKLPATWPAVRMPPFAVDRSDVRGEVFRGTQL